MRRLVALVAVLLVPATAHAANVETPYCEPRTEAPQTGLKLVGAERVDDRTTELTLESKAMERTEKALVMLPPGYDPASATRYPVLYLLHGALDDYRSWFDKGEVQKTIGDRPWIVVMPNGGRNGSYSDWYGLVRGTADPPPPAWETHHIQELIPWIDAAYHTRTDRGGRAIGGLSMGGAGTMKYAAAHPELFTAAGSFSGAVNTTIESYPQASQGVWAITLYEEYGPPAHCTWGDPHVNEVIWRDNDPTHLAENLRGVDIFLAGGDGTQGPYDPTPTFDPVEWTTWQMTQGLAAALDGLGIPHTDHFYGPGTHTWPYWQRELKLYVDWLDSRLGRPVSAAPRSFDYRSARVPFTAWGWRFTPRRDVREFTYLEAVSSSGLTATGSGLLDVVTPPLYSPGARYTVGRAGRDRRLRFTVDLGPSHAVQQVGFAAGERSGWTTVSVPIRRLKAIRSRGR